MWPDPESEGFNAVASVSGRVSYEWDQTDVWFDPLTKWFFIYEDSGCSCNGPYEGYTGIGDLDGPFKSIQELLASISDMDLIEQVLAWERRNR